MNNKTCDGSPSQHWQQTLLQHWLLAQSESAHEEAGLSGHHKG